MIGERDFSRKERLKRLEGQARPPGPLSTPPARGRLSTGLIASRPEWSKRTDNDALADRQVMPASSGFVRHGSDLRC